MLILTASILGCGEAYPLNGKDTRVLKNGESAKQNIAAQLNLEIRAGNLDALPGSNLVGPNRAINLEEVSLDYDQKFGEKIITFLKPIQLPNSSAHGELLGKSMYFVWSESLEYSRIIHVTVHQQTLGWNQKRFGDLKLVPAWFDFDHKRWVLPVSEVVCAESENATSESSYVDSANYEVVTLELSLSDLTKELIEIRFRIFCNPFNGASKT